MTRADPARARLAPTRLVAAALAALLALLALAPAAGAHATIVRTTPSDRAVVGSAPRTVQIRWSEAVDLGPDSVRLLDATGEELDTPKATHAGGDAATAVLRLPAGLKDGTYVVTWRVTSADSHPVAGAFSFSIGEPSAVVVSTEPGATSPAVKVADGIARGVAFLGFALAIGGAAVLLLLGGERRGVRWVWRGAALLAGATVVLLLLQGPYATGGSLLDPSLLWFSLKTRFGEALVARLLLTAGFVVLVTRPQVTAASVCAVGLTLTWTLADHSRTGVQPWLGVPAASLHLLAMGLWLGGLVALLARDTPRPVLARFSPLALGCFAVLGVTGVYLAWRQSGTPAALPATGFGRLLLVKTGLVLVIVAFAALTRRALARAGDLRRTVLAEAALGLVVLGVTSALVNAAPARVAYVDPVDVTVPGLDGGKVQVRVTPAKQGQNVADLYLVSPTGRLTIPPEVTARLRGPDGDSLPVELGSAEPGHYVATALTIPEPGDWTLRINVRTSEIDERTIDVPVRIR
ncbi:copper resistance protein CopC/CopD [Solirubrobacter phytolaccae]|uniref:Copper resistance protein CopC/CopD n=1 Tax=Solirubrobacter phytolaccae TaxID=1404360 RepID=A0A9X3SEJ8_9ACTN|nr:copper resistance protein CopC [Solirubrobacter phytolaccae]MDA0180467.1 copper resistance protein CopC/CopD [Solirubrobacter phytolaccae]